MNEMYCSDSTGDELNFILLDMFIEFLKNSL